MDSVASDWFWFWLPLLVVVVVVVRALAVPSSLLVSWSSLTSLSHHIWGVIQDPDSSSPTARREQARRLQNGRKRRISTRISRFGNRQQWPAKGIFGSLSESSGFLSFS